MDEFHDEAAFRAGTLRLAAVSGMCLLVTILGAAQGWAPVMAFGAFGALATSFAMTFRLVARRRGD